jgi:hypothetical protein
VALQQFRGIGGFLRVFGVHENFCGIGLTGGV